MSVPRWGWVVARPHEFLVQIRSGQVLRAEQGGSCWKWPRDVVALVDTSLQRLVFQADQVTREKVGVSIVGLAVFRIVEPQVAFRMVDPERASELRELLCDMLQGATRRLVATLTLEECLTRRKDALATSLLAEIAPVVGGSGKVGDTTDQGWGLALDTIEIQDVRVLSEDVFSRLQAPYREALELSALGARAEVAAEQARLAHESFRVEEQRRRERMAVEESRIQAERERGLREVTHRAELAAGELQARIQRERELAQHESAQAEQKARDAVAQARAQAESERVLGEARAEVERTHRAVTDQVSEARLRELLVTQTLPEVARAYAGSFDKIVVTGASDLSVLGQGVTQVLAAAQAFGVALPGRT